MSPTSAAKPAPKAAKNDFVAAYSTLKGLGMEAAADEVYTTQPVSLADTWAQQCLEIFGQLIHGLRTKLEREAKTHDRLRLIRSVKARLRRDQVPARPTEMNVAQTQQDQTWSCEQGCNMHTQGAPTRY